MSLRQQRYVFAKNLNWASHYIGPWKNLGLVLRPPWLIFWRASSLYTRISHPDFSSNSVDIWQSNPCLLNLVCSTPPLRAKCNPNKYMTVLSNCSGLLSPNAPVSNILSSCSILIIDTDFFTPRPWVVHSFIVLSSIFLNWTKVRSSSNFQYTPFSFRWIWIIIIISLNVFGGNSPPSILFTSWMNHTRQKHKSSLLNHLTNAKSQFLISGLTNNSFILCTLHWSNIPTAHRILHLLSTAIFLLDNSEILTSVFGALNILFFVVPPNSFVCNLRLTPVTSPTLLVLAQTSDSLKWNQILKYNYKTNSKLLHHISITDLTIYETKLHLHSIRFPVMTGLLWSSYFITKNKIYNNNSTAPCHVLFTLNLLQNSTLSKLTSNPILHQMKYLLFGHCRK